MLNRRDLLKNTIFTSAGMIVLPHLSFTPNNSEESVLHPMMEGFLNLPSTAKPQAYWMWINGHVTKNGITHDLEVMKEIGLAGAFIYNTGTGIPKGPVDYGSDEWEEMVLHAMSEAKRLGLELFLHNSPGFSSTGATWVSPEMGMQQLVWSEMMIKSNGFVDVVLPHPYQKLDYYRDVFVIAYPSLKTENLMRDKLKRVFANDKEIHKETFCNDNRALKIEFIPADEKPGVILLEFFESFEARAISIYRKPRQATGNVEGSFDDPPFFILECSDDGVAFRPVCSIAMPQLRFMDAPGVEHFSSVKAKYFRLSTKQNALITKVELHSCERLSGWPAKMNFTGDEIKTDERIIHEEQIIAPSTVIDISDSLQADGRLVWNAPPGNWTIFRIGHTCTGTKTAGAPDSAYGLEIDKFSKAAVDNYFTKSLEPLFQKLDPFIQNTFKGILIDSWEIGKQNWTLNFSDEFQQRRNYSIVQWLPALTGRIVKSVKHTESFLFDIRKTHADLVADNYYGHFNFNCKKHKLQLLAQPNGDGIADSLQVGQYIDVPMGEFWKSYVPGTLNICKQAVSNAHGNGKQIVAAEAFTGMPSASRWTEYPFALKPQADHIFSMGINRLIFHVFVHQPYSIGLPGMSMGPYGSHLDRNQTWIIKSAGWVSYLSRTQFLLQQGNAVVDVCYFKGEEPSSGIPDVNYTDPSLPTNINGDVIGPDVLDTIKIKNGKIILPGGMGYKLMILASLKTISILVVQKIKTLVAEGMILVVTSKPAAAIRLGDRSAITSEINNHVEELWGDLDGVSIKERFFGKGKIYWNKPFASLLDEHQCQPDFEFTSKNNDAAIHFTHRQTSEADIYFVSNHLRRKESIVGSFRVKDKVPEIWNAENGEIYQAATYEIKDGRVFMPIELSPSSSLFIIFKKRPDVSPLISVWQNDKELFSARPYTEQKQNSFQNLTDNFTISVWVKPDTNAVHPKGIVIFPCEGEKEYGKGHAACGLAAGQNGVCVFEREIGPNRDARQVISVAQPLQGWTHLAIRYSKSTPSLFINGKLEGRNEGSGKIIHPGLYTKPTDEFFSAAFEGNSTKPELFEEALTDEQILRLFQKGLPATDLPSAISFSKIGSRIKATVWENGNYLLKTKTSSNKIAVTECRQIAIQGPWQIKFPTESGVPGVIELKNLESLHKHPDFNVKHFSGTAVYTSSFLFSKKNFKKEEKLFLDLGRVEVIAIVRVNGKLNSSLWKEPFIIEITSAVKEGNNLIEVEVTNLWNNRMIGDAHLPVENEYDENNIIRKLPDWYLQEKPKTGQRKTFSAWNNFKKTDPLLESGLLGPVRLFVAIEKLITKFK